MFHLSAYAYETTTAPLVDTVIHLEVVIPELPRFCIVYRVDYCHHSFAQRLGPNPNYVHALLHVWAMSVEPLHVVCSPVVVRLPVLPNHQQCSRVKVWGASPLLRGHDRALVSLVPAVYATEHSLSEHYGFTLLGYCVAVHQGHLLGTPVARRLVPKVLVPLAE